MDEHRMEKLHFSLTFVSRHVKIYCDKLRYKCMTIQIEIIIKLHNQFFLAIIALFIMYNCGNT